MLIIDIHASGLRLVPCRGQERLCIDWLVGFIFTSFEASEIGHGWRWHTEQVHLRVFWRGRKDCLRSLIKFALLACSGWNQVSAWGSCRNFPGTKLARTMTIFCLPSVTQDILHLLETPVSSTLSSPAQQCSSWQCLQAPDSYLTGHQGPELACGPRVEHPWFKRRSCVLLPYI